MVYNAVRERAPNVRRSVRKKVAEAAEGGPGASDFVFFLLSGRLRAERRPVWIVVRGSLQKDTTKGYTLVFEKYHQGQLTERQDKRTHTRYEHYLLG